MSTDSPESNRKAQIDALLLKLPEVVTRLTQALAKAGADKELLAQINATGCDTEFLTPAQTVEKIKADYVKWGAVVKEANIRPE